VPALIGYYVHHQGDGHRQRALAISSCAPERFVLMGTGLAQQSAGPVLALDDDRPVSAAAVEPASPLDCLHYVPMRHAGIQRRVAQVANWIAQNQPALIVVDVSVEIAMLARLASIPTVYVRLAGRREDAGHLQAFRAARWVLAPFHEELDDLSVPEWVRAKTRYVPGLIGTGVETMPDPRAVLVVNGRGGGILDGETLAAAASATPDFRWRVIGPASAPRACPENLEFRGWVSNAEEEIGNAGIVVGTAGDGVVSAVIAAGRPFVCLPQDRPYGEQLAKARRLAALDAALVFEHMPSAGEWRGILERARALNPSRLTALHDPHGARTACELLQEEADR